MVLHLAKNGVVAASADKALQGKIQKLLTHLLSKYILVKDYSLALHYAKENNLNCITAQQEMVYAGGFLTKVGSQSLLNNQDKVSLFKLYQQLKQEIRELEDYFARETKEKDGASQLEVKLKRQVVLLQNQMSDNEQRVKLLAQNQAQ